MIHWNKPVQEFKNAGAISGDSNIAKIYRLENEYKLGIRPLPLDPEGNFYKDPKCDPHIIASTNLHPRIKEIVENTPWLANPDNDPFIKEFRQKAKIINYGAIYLISAPALAEQLKCNLNEAKKFLESYFSYPDGFHELYKWLQITALCGSHRRWVRTGLGGMLFVNDSNSKGLSDHGTVNRKSCNTPVKK